MKYLHLIFCFTFVLFAFIQLNDPDPIFWVVVYLATALVPLLYFFKKSSLRFTQLLTILLIIAISLYFKPLINWFQSGMPSVAGSMQAENYHIELVREAGGLLICLISTLTYQFLFFKSKKQANQL